MIDQTWTFLQNQLQTNNVFSGVALVGVLGGVVAMLRNIPMRIYNWCVQRVFMEFEITSKDRAFEWLEEWLATQPYTKNRARWLSVKTLKKGRRSNEPPEIILSPAPGVHWLFWNGYFVILDRQRKDPAPSGNGNGSGLMSMLQPETFIVKVLTRRRDLVRNLLLEARDVATPPEDTRVEVLTPSYGSWDDSIRRRPRAMESVILAEGVAEALVTDIERFLASEEWYVDRGIPYRRGFLLYGPPGSGKSSIVFALASHLKLDIAILGLSDPNMADKDIQALLSNVPPNTLVLIEDIDCVFNEREEAEDKDNKVTFSGLLNALDGVASSEGTILFMTTNHIEKLDEALIRAGRTDVKQFIGLPDDSQIARMFLRFFPGQTDAAQTFAAEIIGRGAVSMAAVQGHFLQHRHSFTDALDNVQELYGPPTDPA